jgi:hypothetical protein
LAIVESASGASTAASMDDATLARELSRLLIQYYFVWQPGPVPAFLRDKPEIDVDRILGLRVFSMRGG